MTLQVNAAAAKLFQFTPNEMIGKNINMQTPAALAALHDGFMAHHIETDEKRIIDLGRDVEGQRCAFNHFSQPNLTVAERAWVWRWSTALFANPVDI